MIQFGQSDDLCQGSFQFSDVGFDVGGNVFDHFIVNVVAFQFFFFPEDGHAGLIVRRLDIHGQAPFKSGTKAFLQGLNIFGRFIRGYDDLLFGLIQGIKCVEKFLLSTLLADNKLYIVDEQHIVVSVFFPEFGGCDIVLVPDGIDQLIGKFL